MLPTSPAPRRPLACLLTVAVVLVGQVLSVFAQPAANGLPRKPSAVHTPMVATPAPGDAPGYREQLTSIAERYARLYYTADLRGAFGEARRGLALAEKARNLADEAQFIKALGYVSWLLGDTAAAIDYEQRLLALADTLADERLRANALRTLGTVHRQIGEAEKGRQHTEAALAAAERAGDESLRIGAINNLAVFALDAGDIATARRLHQQVLAHREKQGEPWDIAGSLSNLADVSSAERDHTAALALHERALQIRRQIGDQRGIVRSLRQAAGSLRALGRTDEALARLEEALASAKHITGHELLRDTWQEITLTRESRGEFAAALAAEREAGKARDALAGERARTRVAELQARYDDARKQDTIARLEREQHLQATELRARQAEISAARVHNLWLIACLLVGTGLLGGIIWLQRARLRAERLARDAAEQANALKSSLVSMVSHDIRSPLTSTLALAEELRAEHNSGTPDERLDLIVNETSRVIDLAQDLLDVSAIEGGGLKLTVIETDLAEVVAAVIARDQARATAKRQSLRFVPPSPGSCRALADRAKLQQAFANLLGNAIKYSPINATIGVELMKAETDVHVVITDEGPGFTEDDRRQLFKPFTRLSAQPTGGESSHGLGLAIANEIIRKHGGALEIQPRKDRSGSRVMVVLRGIG